MINSVTVTNHLGESVEMELRFPEKSGFLIFAVEGLGPPKATINMVESATSDGAYFNFAKTNTRNIVFHIGMYQTEESTIEDLRLRLYYYFPLKRKIKISVKTDNRECEIYGYVESNEPVIFSKFQTSVISVICPDPYFRSTAINTVNFSGLEPLFEFPFSNESLVNPLIIMGNTIVNKEQNVVYTGDAATGLLIYIKALDVTTNLRISNIRTSELMTISDDRLTTITGSGIIAGDEIVISTVTGSKSITLLRNGVAYNILHALLPGSKWFKLERGDNLFRYATDEVGSNLLFRVENQVLYEGV